ncbi:hypothetical protein BKN38_09060 [Helicobacter sp. CLO-3]|uniref:DUF1104 domain-containing protein n=1 Tax=unclassified Helicobacter TaxID=2593540 RepID=UPI00080577BA|nr:MULTISPECIES: DUF1104 domain-containing protein [unclassified Helicobacter]OBV28901.1 hypothetical protein BA723_07635 [Helicobacter sp. CLO-3]OHU81416.1 hypothetical protein BKN38_09060 [Helicobacter sp. CLO-3]
MKRLAYFMAIGLLGSSLAYAADFSKKSDKELISLAANISAQDEPDFIMEVEKRAKSKLYEEAKSFKKAVKDARHEARAKLTPEQAQKRAIEVCKATQAKTDKMNGKEIRESGLRVFYGDCNEMPKRKPHDEKGGKSGKPAGDKANKGK